MLEPDILPVDGEAFELKTANKQDDARSDIRAEGFWGKKRRAFFDVMVFTPFARSYSTRSLKAIYAVLLAAYARTPSWQHVAEKLQSWQAYRRWPPSPSLYPLHSSI